MKLPFSKAFKSRASVSQQPADESDWIDPVPGNSIRSSRDANALLDEIQRGTLDKADLQKIAELRLRLSKLPNDKAG
jgi:hypothetical protein